ncbi:hypothetical protein BC937DRAFT_92777 [Endogone sp. FLAS-F59071]|nr:hypothetical protein BC937DRAFT_92777 [Endogone sp. FLAS-F59071]|eukprot:RUS15193.1 hypothetical protein BC937DRAFT_92777 [Endogone sp. FLAS-F59071]
MPPLIPSRFKPLLEGGVPRTAEELVLVALLRAAPFPGLPFSLPSKGPAPNLTDKKVDVILPVDEIPPVGRKKRGQAKREQLSENTEPPIKASTIKRVEMIENFYGTEVCRNIDCFPFLLKMIKKMDERHYGKFKFVDEHIYALYTLLLPYFWRCENPTITEGVHNLVAITLRRPFGQKPEVSMLLANLLIMAQKFYIVESVCPYLLQPTLTDFRLAHCLSLTVVASSAEHRPDLFRRLAVLVISVALLRDGLVRNLKRLMLEALIDLHATESLHIIRKYFRNYYFPGEGEGKATVVQDPCFLACLARLDAVPSQRDLPFFMAESEVIPNVPAPPEDEEIQTVTQSREVYDLTLKGAMHVSGLKGCPINSRMRICWTCRTSGTKGHPMRTCQGCGVAVYCGIECQKEDWNDSSHRTQCLMVQEYSRM